MSGGEGITEECGADGCVKRWDVAQLQCGCFDARGRMTTRGKYLSGLKKRVCESWVEEGSVSEKWEVLKSALCDEAEAVIDHEDRKQPNWFLESGTVLRPLLKERIGCMLCG